MCIFWETLLFFWTERYVLSTWPRAKGSFKKTLTSPHLPLFFFSLHSFCLLPNPQSSLWWDEKANWDDYSSWNFKLETSIMVSIQRWALFVIAKTHIPNLNSKPRFHFIQIDNSHNSTKSGLWQSLKDRIKRREKKTLQFSIITSNSQPKIKKKSSFLKKPKSRI